MFLFNPNPQVLLMLLVVHRRGPADHSACAVIIVPVTSRCELSCSSLLTPLACSCRPPAARRRLSASLRRHIRTCPLAYYARLALAWPASQARASYQDLLGKCLTFWAFLLSTGASTEACCASQIWESGYTKIRRFPTIFLFPVLQLRSRPVSLSYLGLLSSPLS